MTSPGIARRSRPELARAAAHHRRSNPVEAVPLAATRAEWRPIRPRSTGGCCPTTPHLWPPEMSSNSALRARRQRPRGLWRCGAPAHAPREPRQVGRTLGTGRPARSRHLSSRSSSAKIWRNQASRALFSGFARPVAEALAVLPAYEARLSSKCRSRAWNRLRSCRAELHGGVRQVPKLSEPPEGGQTGTLVASHLLLGMI